MAIPSNLLPINNPLKEELREITSTQVVSQTNLPKVGIPSTLLPVNTSQISASIQSLAGTPTDSTVQIPQFPVLNTVLPDNLFTTGSIDQIRTRTLGTATKYLNSLPLPRFIPTIPSITIPFPPKRPSYGQIKNFINTKIDRIKRQRQQASIKSLREELKKQEDPFAYRQSLRNTHQNNKVNNVLGRFNNQ